MPSSAAVTVIVPDWITSPSFDAMPSFAFPSTVSAPPPVTVRSAVENSAAFGSSVSASGEAEASPSARWFCEPSASTTTTSPASLTCSGDVVELVRSAPSSTTRTVPSSGLSTTTEPSVSVPLSR